MSYAQETGYTPLSFETLMNFVREGVNTQFGTDYTTETFIGTSWYKYFYVLIQKVQENEIKTSEIFQKLQEYIGLTNEGIQRPSVSHPGLIEALESEGFTASVKPPALLDAGTISICIDLDDSAPGYAASKLLACTKIKDFVTAGILSTGTETESIALSNGQSFDFSFHLPTRIPVLLRLTLTKSLNTPLTVPADESIRQIVFDNANARYRLGWNFEPQRYFGLFDALWASTALLEWSDDAGANWHPEIFTAEFTDLFEFGLEDIEIVVT